VKLQKKEGEKRSETFLCALRDSLPMTGWARLSALGLTDVKRDVC
jgi:hypothetical protein